MFFQKTKKRGAPASGAPLEIKEFIDTIYITKLRGLNVRVPCSNVFAQEWSVRINSMLSALPNDP